MNATEIEEEIKLYNVFIYVYKNLISLFLIFFALSIIGTAIFINYLNLKPESHFSQYSFSIENDQIKEVLSPSYILNMNNFILAAKESNIDENINLSDSLSNFSIVPGEMISNRFIEHVNKENFISLAKNIAIEPKLLKEYFSEITEQSNNYRTLIVNRKDLPISDVALDLFVTNLFKITNKNLSSEFNLAAIKLSNLTYDNTNSDNINLWTLYAKEFLITLTSYATFLRDFSYATPSVSINLDQLEDQLTILNSQFRVFLSSQEGISGVVIEANIIEIDSLELQIASLENIINSLNNETSNNFRSGTVDSNTRENLNISADSFDKILNIGRELSNAKSKEKFLDLLYEKTSRKFNIMKENELFAFKSGSSTYDLTTDFLDTVMKDISNDINHYLKIVSNLGDYSNPIKLFSFSPSVKVNMTSQLFTPLLIIFLSSIFISFSLIILKGLLRNFEA